MDVNPGFLIVTLYIMISGNFLAPLLSCKVQTLLSESMILRHIMGLLTFIFFVGISNVKQKGFIKILGVSLALYTWYVATTRMDIRFWIPLLMIFAIMFLMQTYENTQTDEEKENRTKMFDAVKKSMLYVSFAATILGVLTYYGAKQIEYGKSFDLFKFVFGNASCKNESPDLSIIESLRGLYKR